MSPIRPSQLSADVVWLPARTRSLVRVGTPPASSFVTWVAAGWPNATIPAEKASTRRNRMVILLSARLGQGRQPPRITPVCDPAQIAKSKRPGRKDPGVLRDDCSSAPFGMLPAGRPLDGPLTIRLAGERWPEWSGRYAQRWPIVTQIADLAQLFGTPCVGNATAPRLRRVNCLARGWPLVPRN